jgi:drug/metabolite transporter (DMT)-like permease
MLMSMAGVAGSGAADHDSSATGRTTIRSLVTASTLIVWVVTCAIWSTVWLFIKLGVRDVPPVTFAAFRLSVALAVLVPVTIAQRAPLPARPRDWQLIAATGVLLLGVNYAFLNWGAQFISSGLTAVLQAMTPVFGFVFAHLLLDDERMTTGKSVALGVGVAGVAAIVWDQFDIGSHRAVSGSVAVVGSAACVAISYVIMRRRVHGLHPSVITSGQMLAALGPLLIYALAIEGNPLARPWSTTAVASGVYLALAGSVAGAWLNYWLLKRIGATKLLSMGLVEPLVAVLLGAAILGERMSLRTAVGGICILAAVAVVLDLFRSKS